MSAVAVIIVNWNSWELLARCLEALKAQTFEDFSITIIDNASIDKMPVHLMSAYPKAVLVRNVLNSGFAAGNNFAVNKYALDSDWIALINADAFAEPHWLEALVDATKANPGFDVFGSKLLNASDSRVLDGIGDTYHVSGRVWREGKGLLASKVADLEHEIFSPCAAAALYKRSALLDVGGFDEDFFCYVEDVDLGFRLRLAGYRCLYVPKSVAHHVGSGTTGGQHSDFSIYHGHRNLVWTFLKDMPGVLFWLLLPIHLLLNVASVAFFTVRGKGKVIWRSKRDAFFGLPKMWRKRQIIQKNRVATVSEIWHQLDKRIFVKKP